MPLLSMDVSPTVTVYIFHFLRQFDLQGITSRFYTDVATGESAGCFALYTQGVAQLDLAAGPTVARKGQAVVFRFVKRCFGRLTQVNYIVRDIGCSIFRASEPLLTFAPSAFTV